jgi:hypothetical protein
MSGVSLNLKSKMPIKLMPTTPERELGPMAGRVVLPIAWQFVDIHAQVLGPNTVKITWTPLPGANQYVVHRDGVQIGPVYSSDPAATQAMSAIDTSAPANSNVTYTVVASNPSSTV